MIVTLCGSGRFEPWFHVWSKALGLAGHPTFGLASYRSQNDGHKDWFTPEQKEALDDLHLKKITASDAIVFLNVFAYMGESTLREFAFANDFIPRKKIYVLGSWGRGCGISANHVQWLRSAAIEYGIPREYGSPVAIIGYPIPHDLLGPAGAKRSGLVDLIKREEWIAYKRTPTRDAIIRNKPLPFGR